jgi:hypothetical protein
VTGSRALHSMALGLVMVGLLGCLPPTAPVAPAGGARAPQIACQGVPDTACKQAFDTIDPGARPAVAQLVVRCSKPVCTEQSGEADILIIFVDGRRETSNYGWDVPAGAAPIPVVTPPPLPVNPNCEGLPSQKCVEMAIGGLDGVTAAVVGRITVHCSAVCTPTSGMGFTTYDFVDGRPSVTSSWSYDG